MTAASLRPTPIAAFATVIALVASACAGSADSDRSSATTADVELAALQGAPTLGPNTHVLQYDDGFNHYVVTTTGSPSGPADATLELSGVDRLFTADGVVSVEVPAESLRIVAPASQLEADALARHADATIAFLVKDTEGIVDGSPALYVYTENGLHAFDAAPVAVDRAVDDADSSSGVVSSELDRRVVERIEDLEGTVDVTIVSPGLISVVTEDSGDDLADVSGVSEVHDDVTFGFSDDPMQRLQWALDNTGAAAQANGRAGTPGAAIDAPNAWNASRGAGVVVAVIDSGVQLDHPDLAGRFHTNADELCGNGIDDDANGFIDDCAGWDFGAGDANPSPDGSSSDAGHGTHGAGLIAAGDNGIGVVGVAPDALIMPIKIARPDGLISTAALTGAIDYATANGADVINLSLGTNPGVPRGAVTAIESSVARAVQSGVVVVAAAGNNGVDITNQPVWPSSLSEFYSGVINVGSSNNNDGRSFFSNFGGPVSIWAPGEGMLSTALNSRHEWRSGTSMATPVVAGAAALVLATETVSPGDVRSHLQNTGAQAVAGTRLDAAAAVGASTATAVSVALRGADALRPDTAANLSIDVSARNADDASHIRLSVATVDQGAVAAVGDLTARISGPVGSIDAVTDASGSFPMLPLAGGLEAGVTIVSQLAMPAGQYAVVTELLSADGQAVGEPQVVYLTVADESTAPITNNPPSSTPPATAPPANQTPAAPPATSPTPAPPTANNPVAPTTVVPSPVGPTVPTTTPPPANGPAPIGPEVPQTPITTPTPSPSTPGTSAPATSTPTTPTPTPAPAPTTPTTPSPALTPPGAPTPPNTTPAPAPDADGDYRLTSMSPRAGSTLGGDFVVIDGEFPTNVPVYVWFDELAVVAAHINTGTQLTVRTPAVSTETITDVTIRFTTSARHELTLRDAFTFVAPSRGNTPAPTTPPTNSTPPAPATPPSNSTPPTNGAVPGTVTPNPVSPSPTTPSPVPTTPPGTSPAPPAPTPNPTPPSTAAPQPAPAPSAPINWVRDRGSLTLRPPAPGTALASLSAAAWQPGCSSASCSATSF
ncbi:MAG: S8 family serine peptidase [Ilumatobacter sp.]